MGSIGATELIIIAVVLVVLFGASRLPATAKGLGQALRVFKKEVRDDEEQTPAEDTAEEALPELTTGPDDAAKSKPGDKGAAKPAADADARPAADVKASTGADRSEA